MQCNKCGKQISDDEYVVNWTTCSDCFDKDYFAYLKEHPLTEKMEDFDL